MTKHGRRAVASRSEFPDAAPLHELVGSPVLTDLNADNVSDVVIGGRDGTLIAVDGRDGTTLWNFNQDGQALENGWFNFYTPQVVNDVNDDGTPDFLVANGGNAQKAPLRSEPPVFSWSSVEPMVRSLRSPRFPTDKRLTCLLLFTPRAGRRTTVRPLGNRWRNLRRSVVADYSGRGHGWRFVQRPTTQSASFTRCDCTTQYRRLELGWRIGHRCCHL